MVKYVRAEKDISQVGTDTTVWMNYNQFNYGVLALVFNDTDKTYQLVSGQLIRPGKYKKVTKPQIYRKVEELEADGYRLVIGPSSVAGYKD